MEQEILYICDNCQEAARETGGHYPAFEEILDLACLEFGSELIDHICYDFDICHCACSLWRD